MAGQADIQNAHRDIAGDFLGAQQNRLKLVVIHDRLVGAGGNAEVPAGFLEQGKSGILQAALWAGQSAVFGSIGFLGEVNACTRARS